jgi:hypothetical protein
MDFKMKKDKMLSKRGQITIWVIVAVLIIASIALFFLLKGRQTIKIFKPGMPSPQEYIEKCAKDSALEAVNIMLPQGGYIQPRNYRLYQNNKVAYLCYNNNFYYPCIMQEPMYIEHLEKEIESYIKPKIKDCFYALKQEYRDRHYRVNDGALALNVELNPKQVKINVEKKFEISKEETRRFEKFKAKLNSPLFDLAYVAREIANQEAKYCSFEYLGYMLFYPMIEIDKKNIGQADTASKIYIIRDRVTKKSLWIAVRGCAIPPGF